MGMNSVYSATHDGFAATILGAPDNISNVTQRAATTTEVGPMTWTTGANLCTYSAARTRRLSKEGRVRPIGAAVTDDTAW